MQCDTNACKNVVCVHGSPYKTFLQQNFVLEKVFFNEIF